MESDRRKFLRDAGFSALGLSLAPGWGRAAGERSYADELPDMLILFLAKQANALAAKWDVERSKVRTPEQTLARGRFVRKSVLEMLGGFPEKNALAGVTTSTFERDGYRVENVRFQSRPDFWVTGNLYLPTSGAGPFPAVISPSGHYDEAGRVPSYQLSHMLMVKNGFAVLAYDPIGQGERRYFWDPSKGETLNVNEHSAPGQRLVLLGESFAQYRIWDGMRAIDYLLTRPEVDGSRIGCTGHSGGGWATLFITLLDDRVKCAACNEPGPQHWWPLETQPDVPFRVVDSEQYLFPAAARGIDRCDVYQAIAPRPMQLATEYFVAAPGVRERFRRNRLSPLARAHIEACYKRLGVAEKFRAIEARDEHFLTHKLRLATLDWFSRWFYGKPGPAAEPVREPEPTKNLYCTPTGSLVYPPLGESIHTLILKKQEHLPPERKAPASAADLDNFRRQMMNSLRGFLHHDKAEQPLAVRHVGTTPRRGYLIEQVEFLSEPGIYIPTWVMIPENRRPPFAPLIYVNDVGMQHRPIGMEFGLLEKMVLKGHLVIAADLRGIGDTDPEREARREGTPSRGLFSTETGMAYLAWLMDKSLLGMRVLDLTRTVDYALSRQDVDGTGVAVVGSGMGATWTLFAAALDSRIRSAVCDGGLLSYRTITGADHHAHDASIFIPGVLKEFDLSHVAALVAPRRLVFISPVNHLKRAVPLSLARQAYEFTRRTFEGAGVPELFGFLGRDSGMNLADLYLAALRGTAAGSAASAP